MKQGRKPKPEVSPEIAACTRLTKDGAISNAAIRRRIALIAAERKLDPSETLGDQKQLPATLEYAQYRVMKRRADRTRSAAASGWPRTPDG